LKIGELTCHFLAVYDRPFTVGSREDVLELQRYYEESEDPELTARCEARLKGAVDVPETTLDGECDFLYKAKWSRNE
jgi:hypothetical protein